MPTREGWLLAAASVLVVAGGRLLGLPELYLLGAGGAAVVVAAVAWVGLQRVAVDARRRLVPARVELGGTCRVGLEVANRRGRRTPALVLDDGREARLPLDPVAPGSAAGASYALATTRRGLLAVGPLRVRLTDPFGLAARADTVLGPSTLTVHPRVERVALPPEPPAPAAAGGAQAPVPAALPTGEFHALRPYEEGDDLRRVHWPTSARLDALVVRQDEPPRLRHTTVLLDLRAGVHDGASLERAVSAAAGVVAGASDDDGLVRLVTTGGADTGTAGGEGHLTAVLDLLAAVESDAAGDLRAACARVEPGDGGTVVLVTTGDATPADLRAVAALRAHHPLLLAVRIERAVDRSAGPAVGRSGFDRVVAVPVGASFPRAWARAVADLGVHA